MPRRLIFNLALALGVASGFAFAADSAQTRLIVQPDCKPVKPQGVDWTVAICKIGEINSHYVTEFRFQNGTTIVYRKQHVNDPTTGYATAEILLAHRRFAAFQLEGDESNQILAVDLSAKTTPLNTGVMVGLGSCRLARWEESRFCFMSFECEAPSSPAGHVAFSEFACPRSSRR